MQQLQEIAHAGPPWAAQRAETALRIHQALTSGEISSSEAKELLEDLVRTDRLEAEADDMALKAALVTAIYGVIQIAGAI
jgi:polyhydroxyalkanoate synthesis regulator phasin